MQDPLMLLTVAQFKQQEEIRRADEWRRALAARRTTSPAPTTRTPGASLVARVLGRIGVPGVHHAKPAAVR
jgi:hypothetical protein